ncbi:helix-turn-helix domain-containing protein [Beijerinckia sp. L45]|uniref:helix-turn-helix domain-containing protein n=1 Tax=Beijerinckia sp. L45 TaxID=1641855 RepID=UPI00131B0FB2|nr:helix-turn-helix domain-containing protein [Beijerinckia sp. L45]
MTERFSTEDVAEKDRLDYWQFVCGELIGSVALGDYETNGFSSHINLVEVGDLKVGRFTGVSQTLHRTRSLIKSGDNDDYVVLLESDQLFNLDHCGRQRSGRGGMVLIDITQPYYSSHPERLDVIDVFVPRKALERALGPIRHAPGLCIEADQPSFPVISAFLRSLTHHNAGLAEASAARLSSIAIELIAAGFAEKIEQAPPRTMSGAAILCRAQSYISSHIGVAGLAMQEVAAALNISVRRLHQVAADEGISLIDWMWERRLLRAHAMLSENANAGVAVGAVAYKNGFIDQGHFSRRFKERFGVSPKDVRASRRDERLQQIAVGDGR